jgi:hypothetical protein
MVFGWWTVSWSDGAYPRRERRGIAPAPPITVLGTVRPQKKLLYQLIGGENDYII